MVFLHPIFLLRKYFQLLDDLSKYYSSLQHSEIYFNSIENYISLSKLVNMVDQLNPYKIWLFKYYSYNSKPNSFSIIENALLHVTRVDAFLLTIVYYNISITEQNWRSSDLENNIFYNKGRTHLLVIIFGSNRLALHCWPSNKKTTKE